MKKYNKIVIALTGFIALGSCTKLDENLNGTLTLPQAQESADIAGLTKACYDAMNGPFQDQTGVFCLQDMTSDDCIGPTRGGDWDDNGVWRVLQLHTWDATNDRIVNAFNNLSKIVFNTTNLLNFAPPDNVVAQAKFLRAYAMFYILDLYGQVPFRDPGEDLLQPSRVLTSGDALTQIITDLNDAIPNLANGPANTANKWAAKALLMKCYINKGAFANRQSPSVDAGDMNQVISIADDIIDNGSLRLEYNFSDNFVRNNDAKSTENIFTLANSSAQAGNVRFHWHCGTHYNQTPSGWNGFTTLSDFYDKFEDADQRKGMAYNEDGYDFTENTGMRVGFLEGQQYGPADDDKDGKKDRDVSGQYIIYPLKDRAGNPLVFTRDISPVVSGNVETPGIRVVKYVPDMLSDWSDDNNNGNASNDFVMLRYADVLLMKAEALLRTGNTADALTIVNEIRDARGASTLLSVDLNAVLDERGRELYWEGWRRNDLIRFGKFLEPDQIRTTVSDPKYLLFPIPSSALAVNPNLTQNPGY